MYLRLIEFDAKQTLDPLCQCLPLVVVRVLANDMAEIAQNFRGAALTDARVDRALVETDLIGRQPRHGRQEHDFFLSGLVRNPHALLCIALGDAQWATVEGFRIGVIELQAAFPYTVCRYSLNDDLDADVFVGLGAIDPVCFSRLQLTPKKVGLGRGSGDQVPPVDRDSWALFRRLLAEVFFIPVLQPRMPQGQGLQGGGFSRVVGSDQHNRAAQFKADFV